MTELYRGLLTILTTSLNELMLKFKAHIRGFNTIEEHLDAEIDLGVMGFWNLMLEIIMDFYVITAKFFGIVLLSILAVVFYPGFAILNIISRSFRGIFADSELRRIEAKIQQNNVENDQK
jgi:hypothetical protein